MEYVNVISSTIRSVAYDPESRIMGVIFSSGAEYHYRSVDQDTYDRVRTAASVGHAFDALLKKGGYAYERVR